MIPINLRLENKLISKNLIAALAPLPRVLGRYREARKSLRGSISRQSRQGLDWMNFFWPMSRPHSVPSSPFILLIWAGQKVRSVWPLLLGRLLASSARFRAGHSSMHCGGNGPWRELALACFAYQP
jgi:hypothetical protein